MLVRLWPLPSRPPFLLPPPLPPRSLPVRTPLTFLPPAHATASQSTPAPPYNAGGIPLRCADGGSSVLAGAGGRAPHAHTEAERARHEQAELKKQADKDNKLGGGADPTPTPLLYMHESALLT